MDLGNIPVSFDGTQKICVINGGSLRSSRYVKGIVQDDLGNRTTNNKAVHKTKIRKTNKTIVLQEQRGKNEEPDPSCSSRYEQ